MKKDYFVFYYPPRVGKRQLSSGSSGLPLSFALRDVFLRRMSGPLLEMLQPVQGAIPKDGSR